MKFRIHIGSPKAGSSFLQSACTLSRSQLQDQGVYWPRGTHHDERRMQGGSISGGNAVGLAKAIWAGKWGKVHGELSQHIEGARRRGCEIVLLSSEWLLGALANDHGLAKLYRELSRLDLKSSEFLLILRDPVDQLLSHYKHRSKSGQTGSLKDWVERDYLLPVRLSSLRSQLGEVGSSLVVRGYDQTSGFLEGMFFVEWLQVALPVQGLSRRVNPSLTLSELLLLRELRASEPLLVPLLYQTFLAVDRSSKCESPAMREYAVATAFNAVARHADEWSHWLALLPEGERFPMPEGTRPVLEEPDCLELSGTQAKALAELLAQVSRPRAVFALFWLKRLRPALAVLKNALFFWRRAR